MRIAANLDTPKEACLGAWPRNAGQAFAGALRTEWKFPHELPEVALALLLREYAASWIGEVHKADAGSGATGITTW